MFNEAYWQVLIGCLDSLHFDMTRHLSVNPIIWVPPCCRLTTCFCPCLPWPRTVHLCLSVRQSQTSWVWIWRVSLYMWPRRLMGAVLTSGRGALLHLVLWVGGSGDNGAVNTPDGDLWVLWKFNVTLRATCAHWGQRWAQSGDAPSLPRVSSLETKC